MNTVSLVVVRLSAVNGHLKVYYFGVPEEATV